MYLPSSIDLIQNPSIFIDSITGSFFSSSFIISIYLYLLNLIHMAVYQLSTD